MISDGGAEYVESGKDSSRIVVGSSAWLILIACAANGIANSLVSMSFGCRSWSEGLV